jgi:hypothetical protein
MVPRIATLVFTSVWAGGFWGALAAAQFSAGPIGALIGVIWGAVLAPIPAAALYRKPPWAIVAWLGATTAVLLAAMTLDDPLVSFGASTAAYIAACIIIAFTVPRQPKPRDPNCCHSCGYSRKGLPGNLCPECGTTLS